MKIFTGILMILIIMISCKKKGPFAKSLSQTDSLVIQFYSEKEVLENAATTASKDAINKVIELVDSKETDSVHCLKDGLIVFFSGNKEIQRVTWKSSCRQFEYNFQGRRRFGMMSNEAVVFLADIEKGEN